MIEAELKRFLNSGKSDDAIALVKACVDRQCPHIAIKLSTMILNLFPNHPSLAILLSGCYFELGMHFEAYDMLYKLSKLSLSEDSIREVHNRQALCIPFIADKYTFYPSEIVQRLSVKEENKTPMITFTITTCKRYDLFEKTMNSFLNCCSDVNKIDKWFCVDDNSSEEDRAKMKEKYPFFQFYFKTMQEKGHPQSMNIIRNNVLTPYIFHMEDDWKFFYPRNYITDCLEVINLDDRYGQCLINKNYGETEKDTRIIGGDLKYTPNIVRYFIHEHCSSSVEYDQFYQKHGPGPNCAYWKHFSFRPSLIRKYILDSLGPFNETASHFEAEYSNRYYENKYLSTFLDGIYSLHIGRLTSEIGDTTKLNAYALNNEKQFYGKEEPAVPQPQVQVQPVQFNTRTDSVKLRTFVINLDRRPDRWENFVKHDEPKFLNYERFRAIDGSKLEPNKQLQRIFEGNDYNMREGIVGCAMSHIKLWIELASSNCEAYCVLEDDLEFVPNFQSKFEYTLSILPEKWDICFLGHHLWEKYKSPSYYDKTVFPILERWTAIESLKYSMGGTGGYIISRQGALNMLELINRVGMTNGIDTMMQKASDFLAVYYCKPHLIYSDCWTPQTKTDTDIQLNNHSLSLLEKVDIKEYPERLKKNGVFSITDAIKERPEIYIIPCSEMTHTYEAIRDILKQDITYPFDISDNGYAPEFVDLIIKIIKEEAKKLENTLMTYCKQTEYSIRLPHEKHLKHEELVRTYITRFLNLRRAVYSGKPVVFVHVTRWRYTIPEVFYSLVKAILPINKNIRVLTINGIPPNTVSDPTYDKYIYKRYLDYPTQYRDESWANAEQVSYDQNVFRVNLVPFIRNCLSEIQF